MDAVRATATGRQLGTEILNWMKDGILAPRRLSFRAATWVSFKSPSEADWQDSNRYSIRRRVTPGHRSGGFSARIELHMVLLRDGHCVRTARTVASSTFTDSMGNWSGSMDSDSGLPPDERGRWRAAASMLTLEMDDGSLYEYRYTLEGSSLLTRTSKGQRLWVRGRA